MLLEFDTPIFLSLILPYLISCSDLCLWQLNKASIIVDASKYINELKQKVERLNQDTGTSQSSKSQNSLPAVHIYIYYNFNYCIQLISFVNHILPVKTTYTINFIVLWAGYCGNPRKGFPY